MASVSKLLLFGVILIVSCYAFMMDNPDNVPVTRHPAAIQVQPPSLSQKLEQGKDLVESEFDQLKKQCKDGIGDQCKSYAVRLIYNRDSKAEVLSYLVTTCREQQDQEEFCQAVEQLASNNPVVKKNR